MNLRLLSTASFLLALTGLFLIVFFYPNQVSVKKSLSTVQKYCYGTVQVEGTVNKISLSQTGNLIAELSQNKSSVMVVLQKVIEEGSNVSIFGKASKFSNQCWIFPERVELR
jgi:hypothetical protein